LNAPEKTHWMTRLVDGFLRGDVSLMLIAISLLLGLAALLLTPREEEPQIVVPMADVLVSAPGLSAKEVESQVTTRLEKLLWQVDGVEYVYSMSRPGECVVTVRFFVGENREASLVKLYNKLHSNIDAVPPVVEGWVVKPVEIDDVPIVNFTLWSRDADRHGPFELRRVAEEIEKEFQAIPNTNRVRVIGGLPRRVRVELDPARLAARQTTTADVTRALAAGNIHGRAGSFQQEDQEILVETGEFFTSAEEIEDLVIRVVDDRPVYLKNVADITDGPIEVDNYTWIGFGPADEKVATDDGNVSARDPPVAPGELYPAVHIAVAKRKGSNAVWVADAVEARMKELAAEQLPDGIAWRITRNYGETANEKVNELVESLGIAVLTVIGLIGLMLGWRPALVIAVAIPVCYSLTLFVNLMVGYTINRVTMFALILALGLLVDDPITDVENIARYFRMRILPSREALLRAVQEVRPALILSTLAIIVSFLPLMFITGMMGPYMAPMALNVPLTVTTSTLVSFFVTPWLALVALRRLNERPHRDEAATAKDDDSEDAELSKSPMYRTFRTILLPVLNSRWLSLAVLAGIGVLFMAAMAPGVLRRVPLKMLPYDNKNEFHIVIDMPESSTLERTDAVARQLSQYLAGVNEVRDITLYSGVASPMDFNGMVRHYFMRRGPNLAEIRVNLAHKDQREQQSHDVLLRIRDDLTKIARDAGARVKLVEVPPGPPVLATLTGEVYGPPDASYEDLIAAARRVESRLRREPGIVDVDSSAEDRQTRFVFVPDKPKAALSGISAEEIVRTLTVALSGAKSTVLHPPHEVDPLWVELRFPRERRSSIEDLENLFLRGASGKIVQLGELGKFIEDVNEQTIYHKNLKRVVFVYGEVAGRPPAEAIIDMQVDQQSSSQSIEADDEEVGDADALPRPASDAAGRTWLTPGGGDAWNLPEGYRVSWAGEGEWKITLDVFRDLGLAFAAAQIGIFVILMFQTGSRLLPLVIMLAIPLTLIGVMPGFWLLNTLASHDVGGHPTPVFFTATAMIGMIALSGIVVRNSLVLIEFVHMAVKQGIELKEALIRSAAVRTRPILLTAGTTLLGNWVITLDPIFSGLAWSIIFGIAASTVFTLVVIPIVYWLLYGGKQTIETM
jgi:multidrug efflux pump subunit AcrB